MESERGVPPPEGISAGSTAWKAIEEKLREHDEGTIKSYSDDVDTLLVFAGLFSAVVTTFAAQASQSLQPDNADLSVKLLAQISDKITNSSSGQGSPALTAANLATSQLPSTTTIWVNSLWFLSLIFSVSAALLGIFVKQWLREYMHWKSVLASPRENVLVRQMRFEAFVTWKVTKIISSIPAFLQIAVLLFLSGMLFFLWSLNDVVALVCSAAVAAVVLAVSTFTLLPLFFLYCPYRSPTALGVLHVIHSLRRLAAVALCQQRQRRSSPVLWRERELMFLDDSRTDAIPVGDAVANFPNHPILRRLRFLVRALAWMHHLARNERIQVEISKCAQTLPEHRFESIMFYEQNLKVLEGAEILPSEGDLADADAAPLLPKITSKSSRRAQETAVVMVSLGLAPYSDSGPGSSTAWVVRRKVLGDLETHVDYWIENMSGPDGPSMFIHKDRVEELLSLCGRCQEQVLRLDSESLHAKDFGFVRHFNEYLVQMFNLVAPYIDGHSFNVTEKIIELLLLTRTIRLDEQGYLTVERVESTTYWPNRARVFNRRLAFVERHHNIQPSTSGDPGLSPHTRHRKQLLLAVCRLLISHARTEATAAKLLPYLQTIADSALSAGEINLGGYVDPGWTACIDSSPYFTRARLESTVKSESCTAVRAAYLRLLFTLAKSNCLGLFNTNKVAHQLSDLVSLHSGISFFDPFSVDGQTLPNGWVRRLTEDGKTYYINLKTKMSTWVRPTTSTISSASADIHGGSRGGEEEARGNPPPPAYSVPDYGPLPPGWEWNIDADGRVQYIHLETEFVTRTRPTTGDVGNSSDRSTASSAEDRSFISCTSYDEERHKPEFEDESSNASHDGPSSSH